MYIFIRIVLSIVKVLSKIMYKVLVFGMTENPGGVESVIINYYKRLQNKKIHFDFLCNTKSKIAYEDLLINMHSKVYKITARSKNFFNYYKELYSFFKEHAHEYDCIWVNVNNLVNIDYLIMAKKFGIKKRIIHSHNSRLMEKGIKANVKKIIHVVNKKRLSNYATDYWACSLDAAKWFYTDSLLKSTKIIRNAIDSRKMLFNMHKREKIRQKYHLENSLVIGNVGRLQLQKNQKFCLKVIRSLQVVNPNVKMVFVGEGPDHAKLVELVNKYRLNSKVLFVGVQEDIEGWLSAFDTFLFPSLFEGLPLALLEAQANGVPVVASSDAIPQDVKINRNFKFLSLNQNISYWLEYILKTKREYNQKKIYENFCKSGYEINKAASELENIFINE